MSTWYGTPTKGQPDNSFSLSASLTQDEERDHPLLLELSSLRTSLKKFQHVSHASSMQLQSKMMESLLVNEERDRFKRELDAAKSELEGIRKITPDNPFPPASAQALSELTLAHRRLSSKLDHIASEYERSQKLVLDKESEASIWRKERDAMAVLVQEWKDRVVRSERDNEEERIRRMGVEEELKIVRLALEECQIEVSAPAVLPAKNAVDPNDGTGLTSQQSIESTLPASDEPTSHASNLCSSCSAIVMTEIPSSSATTLPSTPSNILLGVKGLHRLLADFQSALGASQEKVALLETLADELRASTSAAMQEADEGRSKVARVLGEIESIKAEDHGAGKVVERYMAFTQKTTQQLHSHMQAANTRLSHTVTNLRSQLFATQTLLSREESRSKQLRTAIDELAEGYERETFGRRREVGLRMKALEREERRTEEGKRWVDRVRRERTRLNVGQTPHNNKLSASPTRPVRMNSFSNGGLNGRSNSSTSLSSMLGAPNTYDYAHEERLSLLWELLESGLSIFRDVNDALLDRGDIDGSVTPPAGANGGDVTDSPAKPKNLAVDGSLGRILLAQEMVLGLMADLDRETKRNVQLEKERLTFLSEMWDTAAQKDSKASSEARTSGSSRQAGSDSERPSRPDAATSISTEPESLSILEMPVSESPIASPVGQESEPTNLELQPLPPPLDGMPEEPADASSSSQELPTEATELILQLSSRKSSYLTTQKALHDCAISLSNLRTTRKSLPSTHQAALQILLDGIHDVIEDVRVEVEITIADDDRATKGHQTVLSLNGDEQAIKAANVFLQGGRTRAKETNFERRLRDVEHDLVELKMAVLDIQSEENLDPREILVDSGDDVGTAPTSDPFANLNLKTVTVRTPVPLSRPEIVVSPGLTDRQGLGNNMKRGFFPALSRTFSGTTPVLPLSRATSSNNVHLSVDNGVSSSKVFTANEDDGDVE